MKSSEENRTMTEKSTALRTQMLSVVVSGKEPAAAGVMSFELRSPDAAPLPPFTAGSHIDLELPNGAIRQYSLCNDPAERERYEIGILLEPNGRGGSRSAHENLARGDTVRISHPRNHFPVVPAPHFLLIAGGIGVTPLLSMADHLAAGGDSFELHYCARSPERTAYLNRLRTASYASRVHCHFDDGDAAQRLQAERLFADSPRNTRLYVCGPKGFMDFVTGAARAAGWPESHIHLEYFVGTTSAPADDSSFEVMLASTGQVVTVAGDRTVAQALNDHGIEVALSCEQGICGSCAMRVLDGVPDHRDLYFSPDEHAANDRFTPCCSRAKSARLVIDF
jgi:vanillate monooxygenase ferredoxin subunit